MKSSVKSQIKSELLEIIGQGLQNYGAKAGAGGLILSSSHPHKLQNVVRLDATLKHGEVVIDGGAWVFWDDFSKVYSRILSSLDYATIKPKKWDSPAIAYDFTRVSEKWPRGGVCVTGDNIEEQASFLLEFLKSYVIPFFSHLQTIKSIDEFLKDQRIAYDASWKVTLEFLLQHHLSGQKAACESLKSKGASLPRFQNDQLKWLVNEYCGRVHRVGEVSG